MDADQYHLRIGTTEGAFDIGSFSSNDGQATQAEISGLPNDGSTVHVQLQTVKNGDYGQRKRYVYTAYTYVPEVAEITSPTPGSVLPGTTATFVWEDLDADQYHLRIGTTEGAFDIGSFSSNDGQATQAEISGLPNDGSTVHVQLQTVKNGDYGQRKRYVYTAYTHIPVAAELSAPVPGSVLEDTDVRFTWNGVNAQGYELLIGTTEGGSDILNHTQGSSPGYLDVTGLPDDGSTIYVRLGTLKDGYWGYSSYEYTAQTYVPVTAEMISPVPGSQLDSVSVHFSWDNLGATYRLEVGSSVGADDYFTYTHGNPQTTVTGFPGDGSSTVYVRLWTQVDGHWEYLDYEYTAFTPTAAEIHTPVAGSVLTSKDVRFLWDGVNAQGYELLIGTTEGGDDILNHSQGGSPGYVDVTGLPDDGSTVYVRFGTFKDGYWGYVSYEYMGYTHIPEVAEIHTPAAGSVLTSKDVRFLWNGINAQGYELLIGTTEGGDDILNHSQGGSPGYVDVTGLPDDGSTVYVRFGTFKDGYWGYVSYEYTGYTHIPEVAEIHTPAAGSVLTSKDVRFLWNGINAQGYELLIGTTEGGDDILNHSQGGSPGHVDVTGLPDDGSTVYVRFGTFKDGYWGYVSYEYTGYTHIPEVAEIHTPAAGSVLTSKDVRFLWNGINAQGYELLIGTTEGGDDILNHSQGGSPGYVDVTGLPDDGSTVYVRFGTFKDGYWGYVSYEYTGYTHIPEVAEIHTPAAGSVLTSKDVRFLWNGINAQGYELLIGTTEGGDDILNHSQGGSPGYVDVTGLPDDGSTVYVRFGTFKDGYWGYVSYEYTGYTHIPEVAEIHTPAAGSVLTSKDVRFLWNGINAQGYELLIGTTEGGDDILNHSQGGSPGHVDVTGLPDDGSTVYVRFGTFKDGYWGYVSYEYTAFYNEELVPELTSPTAGSTFTSNEATFTWTDIGADKYQLRVGSTEGAHDIRLIRTTDGTTEGVVTNLPVDGSTVYVHLWANKHGQWRQSGTYEFTALNDEELVPELTSPTAGSTFTSNEATFTWTDIGADKYQLRVGSTEGAHDIRLIRTTDGTTEGVVTNLPVDGSTVYVHLWANKHGQWRQSGTYEFTALNDEELVPELTSPTAGSTFTSNEATFTWTDIGADKYQLRVGSTEGAHDIRLIRTTDGTTEGVVTNLPVDGSTVYVHLWANKHGQWRQSGTYEFTALNDEELVPELTSPTAGSTFTSNEATFTWTDIGADKYQLRVGSTEGAHDIRLIRTTDGTTEGVVTNLPVDGSTVYVHLWANKHGQWRQSGTYEFTALNDEELVPELTSPTAGSTFTSNEATFTWTDIGADKYQLRVGSTEGAHDIRLIRTTDGTTEGVVTNLPVDGSTVYVHLWANKHGQWRQSGTYEFTALNDEELVPELTSPTAGSTFTSNEATFTWTDIGADKYQLRVGSTEGAHDIRLIRTTDGTTEGVVTNLPVDGSTVYVHLWANKHGQWRQSGTYEFTALNDEELVPELTSPTAGSTFTSNEATFTWTDIGADKYQLRVGSTEGAHDIRLIRTTDGTTEGVVTNLPVDGSTVYVHLWANKHGQWRQSGTYEFTAYSPDIAELTSHSTGDVFTSNEATFTWTDVGADQYQVRIGSTPGAQDIHILVTSAGETQATTTHLPLDGSTVYVQTNTLKYGTWRLGEVHELTAHNDSNLTSVLTSHSTGDTFTSNEATFTWTDVGADQYQVRIGSTPGAQDIHILVTSAGETQATTTHLPLDGSTVYVQTNTLKYGTWRLGEVHELTAHNDSNLTSVLTSHSTGDTFTSNEATFTWTDVGADQYQVRIGSTPGAQDIHILVTSAGETQATTTHLPLDGSTVYVQTNTLKYGTWRLGEVHELTAHTD